MKRYRLSPARATRKLEAVQAAIGVSPDAAIVRLVETGDVRGALIAWGDLEARLNAQREDDLLSDRARELWNAQRELGFLKRFVVGC